MPVSLPWRCLCRGFQFVLKVAMYLVPWPHPQVLQGAGALLQIPAVIRGKGLARGFIVTDAVILQLGLVQPLIDDMRRQGLEVTVFSDVTPNPTVDQVEAALVLYREHRCDHIIAVGGGSPMDCAKLVGARAVRPWTPVPYMRGVFRVLWRLPPLFAVPTTAGTGSECTLAAVVVDARTHEKFALMDPFLVPPYAVLDPQLTAGLPPFVTAITGMDALTHGIEAYIGNIRTAATIADSKACVALCFAHLRTAYADGANLEARAHMQAAAHHGGLAFTRAFVGNVHALAHQLGGLYDVPHGYANAVLLPHVLDAYGAAVHERLAELADVVGIDGDSAADKAGKFIAAVKGLNAAMEIPVRFSEGERRYHLRDADFPTLAERAASEANPLYPVPVIWGKEEFTSILIAAQ